MIDCQLADMEHFLVNDQNYGILTVDPTYNLGQFYVTATTYPHLMLQDVTSQKHPSILGPVLVHQRMDFASFNYFSNQRASELSPCSCQLRFQIRIYIYVAVRQIICACSIIHC